MKRFSLCLAAALLCLPGAAWADSIITLDHGTVWQTITPGQNSQAVIEIHNTGDAPDTLTSANCTIADSTLLVDGNAQALSNISIAAGQTVTLSFTGSHLVLNNVHYPITKGGILPCAFDFSGEGLVLGYLSAIPRPAS